VSYVHLLAAADTVATEQSSLQCCCCELTRARTYVERHAVTLSVMRTNKPSRDIYVEYQVQWHSVGGATSTLV
jgi:hypothetical protein